MSQDIFSSIDPAISGEDLATVLNDFKAAIVSGLSGTSRPAEIAAGGSWVDTTNNPTSWDYKIWTGSADITVFTLNLSTSLASVALAVEEFSVKKVSADTAGAILKLVKQRILSNGQVASGDTVGEIRFVGRADDSSNPVVAYLKWDSTDNMTTSAYGGTFGFYSTPDAAAAATLHMRFIDGLVETVLPLKMNSLRLVGQDVATSATIAQLSATKVLVEMTGATATSIQGINSTHASQVVTIHNRSSAVVTLKHQDAGATAVDRIKLPSSTDYAIAVDGSVTLYYNVTDTRWKLISTSDKNFAGYTVDTYYGRVNTWTAPSSVSLARVRAFKKQDGITNEFNGFKDQFGNAYMWGQNANGQLGLGDVTPRSSPVAVLSGVTFSKVLGVSTNTLLSSYGINTAGAAYAWGINTSGQLGVGDVTPRSSPVAVLGGLKFLDLVARDTMTFGYSVGLAAYAWGGNANGQLGVGDVTPRSSPVAVLGGLKFAKIVPVSAAAGAGAVIGLTTAGLAYGWGINTNGNLGTADVTPRSSPVAVVGGLTFADIHGGSMGSVYFNIALTPAGAAYAWGGNTSGQLGLGDVVARSSPVAVLGGLTFKRIYMEPKSSSVLALTSAGALYAWGQNVSGELGVGDVIPRSSPVAVLGGLTFTKAGFFNGSSFGLTTDGTLYTWGVNAGGNLGVGDVVARSSPVAVLGGFKFFNAFFQEAISSDVVAMMGVTGDGTMYTWGSNVNGTLGLGDVTSRSSPVAVVGGFRADLYEPVFSADLTVVPSTAYTISLSPGIGTFANVPLGQGVYKVEVEYLQ